MHELSYARNVLTIASMYAKKNKAKLVHSVTICTTALSGIELDSFKFYWKIITKNSKLKNSKIVIKRIPSTIQCSNCNTIFTIRKYDDTIQKCPSCGSIKTIPIEPTQISIQSIQIES